MLYQMSQNHYRIGSLLVDRKIISDQQLNIAIALQKQDRTKQLGQILVEQNFLTSKELQSALRYQGWLKKVACVMAVSTSLAACGVPSKAEGTVSAGDGEYSFNLDAVEGTPSTTGAEPDPAPVITPDLTSPSEGDSEPSGSIPAPSSDPSPAPSPEPTPDPAPTPDPVVMNVVLNWNPPLQREDGAELSETDIDSYEVHFYNETTGEIEEYTVSGSKHQWNTILPEGEYSFAVSAVDIYGLKSDLSELQGIVIE